jgi:hypothetical protein
MHYLFMRLGCFAVRRQTRQAPYLAVVCWRCWHHFFVQPVDRSESARSADLHAQGRTTGQTIVTIEQLRAC